jgi:hypothetical protein
VFVSALMDRRTTVFHRVPAFGCSAAAATLKEGITKEVMMLHGFAIS